MVDKINELLEANIIHESMSPYSASCMLVNKPDDSHRLVVDFWRLNDKIAGDKYPLPELMSVINQLGKTKYFSTLDSCSGFFQIPVYEWDRYKLAFSTTSGHYDFNRAPLGLKTSPSVYQRLMGIVLKGVKGKICFVYMMISLYLVRHQNSILKDCKLFLTY